MLMKDEEIAKLKIKSSYDDGLDDWQVPPFILRAKEVTLPSLKKNGYDVMEQEKENRDLTIDGGKTDSESEEDEYGSAKNGQKNGKFKKNAA